MGCPGAVSFRVGWGKCDECGDDMGLSLDGMAVTIHPSQAGVSEMSR